MFLAKNDELEVRSKHISNNHIWQLLGWSIFIILLFFVWNDEKETWERVKVIVFIVMGCFYLLALFFNFNYNTSRFILRNNKKIYCQFPTKLDDERGKTYETNIDCVSMAVFADSRDLIFYNREQEQDYVFDLSFFSRDDRQYMINILSQKIKVKIEDKLAQEEHLKLPTTDVFEESQNEIPLLPLLHARPCVGCSEGQDTDSAYQGCDCGGICRRPVLHRRGPGEGGVRAGDRQPDPLPARFASPRRAI